MPEVKVKRLRSDAVVPEYAKFGDAGVDLTATRIIKNDKHDLWFGTDLAFEIPPGYVGLIFDRSSVTKRNLTLSNSVGVIDSGYRGEVQVRFRRRDGWLQPDNTDYKVGERVAQLVIMPVPVVEFTEVDELSDSDRGEGGFGSTGS